MKKAAVLLPVLLLIVAVACGGVSATQVERELYSKIDKGDVAGALALVTDDAVFEVPGCPQGGCKGKEAIKGVLEGIAAQHPTHTIKSSKDSKNTANSQVEVVVDFAKAAGVQRIVANVKLELKGGKISYSQAQFDTSDPQTATFLNFQRLSGLLRQHYEAVNKGDVAAATALFTDDASLVRGGCSPQAPCVGKAAIGLRLERQKANQVRYTVLSFKVSGDTATGNVEFRNVNVTNAGLERVVENFTATFQGDKVSRFIHELDLSDAQSAAFENHRRVAGIVGPHLDAVNLGNVVGAMAAVTEDVVSQGFGLCATAPCAGKAAVQKEIERRITDKTKSTAIAGSVRDTGDTLTARIEVRSDSIKAAGVERILVTETVETKGGKVASVRWVLDAADQQTATFANFARLSGIVGQLYDVGNRGDVPVTAAFFTADATLVRGGCSPQAPCVGKAAIQRQVENSVRAENRVKVLDIRLSGDTLTVTAERRNVATRAAGVERVVQKYTATFKGDKFSRLVAADDLSDSQTVTFQNYARVGGVSDRSLDAVGGDITTVMAFFADDAVFEGFGLCAAAPCAGKAAIQRAMGALAADKVKILRPPGTQRVSGDVSTRPVEIRADSIKAAGVERILVKVTMVVKPDKITSLRFAPDTSDPQTATYLKSLAK